MNNDLTGRHIAITGGSSGIGEATALACVAAGASVALGARRLDRIEDLAARITDQGGKAVALQVDVGEEDQARAFVAGAREQLGALDGLVNNAGLMLLGAIGGADTEEWRRMVHVNLFGVMYCTHAALEVMDGGDIVNVSSVAGRIASAGSGVYNLTKWGVGAFSEALRQEAMHVGVRVTLVEPGAVATELLSHNSDQVKEMAAERFKGVEPLQADDIANAIVYALSQPPYVSVNEILIRPSNQAR